MGIFTHQQASDEHRYQHDTAAYMLPAELQRPAIINCTVKPARVIAKLEEIRRGQTGQAGSSKTTAK